MAPTKRQVQLHKNFGGRSQKAINIDLQEKEVKIGENRKEAAGKSKKDCLDKKKNDVETGFKANSEDIRTTAINRNEIIEDIHCSLEKQQYVETIYRKDYIIRQNFDDRLKEVISLLKHVALLSVFQARNPPYEYVVSLNMFTASSLYMGRCKNAHVSFQQMMRDDCNKCFDNLAMHTIEYVIETVSRRLNEKGPRSRVLFKSCPEIFEEACREAGIKVTPLPYSKCEDLLAYELHFPTNCRMVLAIPMNISDAMEKNYKEIRL